MPKNQAKNNILAQALVEMQKRHVQDYISPKQLVALITVVQNAIDELRTTSGANLTAGLIMFKDMLDSQKKVLDKAVADDTAGTEEMRKAVKTINATLATITNNIKALQSKPEPEEYDDADILDRLDAMQEQLDSVAYDDTAILEQHKTYNEVHKSLQEQIDELRKIMQNQPRGGTVSGGVSDMRIRQSFKYLLKTEQPVGDIDGVNTAYTVSQDIFAVLSFSLNGEVIAELPNYTIAGRTVTFSTALPAAFSGKDFEIKYI